MFRSDGWWNRVERPECIVCSVEGALACAAFCLNLGPARAGRGEIGAKDGKGDGQGARGGSAAHENEVARLEEVLDGGDFLEGFQTVVEKEEVGRRESNGYGGEEVGVEEDGNVGADGGNGGVVDVGDVADVFGKVLEVAGVTHEVA